MHAQDSYPIWHDYFIPGIVIIVFGIVVAAAFSDANTGAQIAGHRIAAAKNIADTPDPADPNGIDTLDRVENSKCPGAANDDCQPVASAEQFSTKTNRREAHPIVSAQAPVHNTLMPETDERYLKDSAGRPAAGQDLSANNPDLIYKAMLPSGHFAQTLQQQRLHWMMMHAHRANELWRIERQWRNRIHYRHQVGLQRWRRLDNPVRADQVYAGSSHPSHRHTTIASSQ